MFHLPPQTELQQGLLAIHDMTGLYEGVVAHIQGREGLPLQVGGPVAPPLIDYQKRGVFFIGPFIKNFWAVFEPESSVSYDF